MQFSVFHKVNAVKGKICQFFLKSSNYFTFSRHGGNEKPEIQQRLIQDNKKAAVLNTSLFFTLDYFGNQNGFFDSVMNNLKT